jgi:hypothetical protein
VKEKKYTGRGTGAGHYSSSRWKNFPEPGIKQAPAGGQ